MSNLLPSFADTSVTTTEEEESYNPDLKEFEVDPETGRLTGQMVTDKDRIRMWIWKCLKTERFNYCIYDWDYGSELDAYMGRILSDEYIKTDVRLAIEEALMVNPEITGITSFAASTDGSMMTITMTVSTVYGDVEGTYNV